jgi:hypothetical protein
MTGGGLILFLRGYLLRGTIIVLEGVQGICTLIQAVGETT